MLVQPHLHAGTSLPAQRCLRLLDIYGDGLSRGSPQSGGVPERCRLVLGSDGHVPRYVSLFLSQTVPLWVAYKAALLFLGLGCILRLPAFFLDAFFDVGLGSLLRHRRIR